MHETLTTLVTGSRSPDRDNPIDTVAVDLPPKTPFVTRRRVGVGGGGIAILFLLQAAFTQIYGQGALWLYFAVADGIGDFDWKTRDWITGVLALLFLLSLVANVLFALGVTRVLLPESDDWRDRALTAETDLKDWTAERNDLERALDVANQKVVIYNGIVHLDEAFLDLLPGLTDETRRHELKDLLAEIVGNTSAIFAGEVTRASAWRPAGPYLQPWFNRKMERQTGQKFYIGDDPVVRRGVAGESFRSKQILIAHVWVKDGEWRSDLDCYVPSSSGNASPPYRSFVCVPLISLADVCIGILCFDSMSNTVFDAPGTTELLRELSKRMVAAITLDQGLSRNRLLSRLPQSTHASQDPSPGVPTPDPTQGV